MPKLTDKFIKQQNEREQKYITVYDKYRPDFNKTVVTAKFYSKYEGEDYSQTDPDLLARLIKARDKGPKEKLEWPETVNQEYGWFLEPLTDLDRNDPRFYSPKVYNEITEFGLKMLQEKHNKRGK